MILNKKWLRVFLATGLCAFAATSQASDWKVTVGAAMVNAPAFKGSDDYQVFLAPTVSVSYLGIYSLSPLDGLSARVVNAGNFSSRVHLSYDKGRRENNNSSFRIAGSRTDALKGLGNVSETALLGLSMQYNFEPMMVSLRFNQATSSHEGMTIDGRLAYTNRFNNGGNLSVGGRLEWGSSDYNQAYFGIDAIQSRNSGLSQFSASSGIISYGVFGSYTQPINQNWNWMVMGGYDRLQSSASDSPLVKVRGNANQYNIGAGVNYSF